MSNQLSPRNTSPTETPEFLNPATFSAPAGLLEFLIVLAILILGAWFRLSPVSTLLVEHFDEGVYASNLFFGDSPEGVYPAQHLYAPGLLPFLIEWWFILFGLSNEGAMGISLVAGVATPLLIWWAGRSWFGPVAGLSAAALAATSDTAILLSRSALTDSLLGLFWVATLVLAVHAQTQDRISKWLLAGLVSGLAWWTKYNGWMPLAIVLAAILFQYWRQRWTFHKLFRALLGWTSMALSSAAVWSLWLWHLQSKGGYLAVAANHRRFVVGPAGWFSSVLRQSIQLDGIVSGAHIIGVATIAAVGLTALFFSPRSYRSTTESSTQEPRRRGTSDGRLKAGRVPMLVFILAGLQFTFLSQVSQSAELLIVGLIGVILGLRNDALSGPLRVDQTNQAGAAVLATWFLTLLFLTPMYFPYLRLTLPWLLSAYLGIGATIEYLVSRLKWNSVFHTGRFGNSPAVDDVTDKNVSSIRPLAWALLIFLMLTVPALVLIGLRSAIAHPTVESQLRPAKSEAIESDFSSLGNSIKRAIAPLSATNRLDDDPLPPVVYVYAEPAVLFQLRLAGLPFVAPASSLDRIVRQSRASNVEVYLLTGPHAQTDKQFQKQFKLESPQFQYVRSWTWKPKLLVALDQPQTDPKSARDGFGPRFEIHLFKVDSR